MYEPIREYLKTIEKELLAKNATEHTHRTALKNLRESFFPEHRATNEPKRIACGAPDFVISKGKGNFTIGYVEAKEVGAFLDEVERSDQMKRYLRSLPNLILTDYLEFRWYVDGKYRSAARSARPDKNGKLAPDPRGMEDLAGLLSDFVKHEPAEILSPMELAQRMARLTHLIRDIIIQAFEGERASDLLKDLRKVFAQVLIPDMEQPEKAAEFADMFAQTLAYGLFAARCNHHGKEPFQRLAAASEIPRTNPFLRKLFETITGPDLDEEP